MIETDIKSLRARFFTQFSTSDPQVLWLGKKPLNINEAEPFVTFSVEPGACELVEKGVTRTHLQLGLVSLFVSVPKGTGLGEGYKLRDKFVALFRNWVSDDKALVIRGSTDLPIRETDTHLILGVRFRWDSTRSY